MIYEEYPPQHSSLIHACSKLYPKFVLCENAMCTQTSSHRQPHPHHVAFSMTCPRASLGHIRCPSSRLHIRQPSNETASCRNAEIMIPVHNFSVEPCRIGRTCTLCEARIKQRPVPFDSSPPQVQLPPVTLIALEGTRQACLHHSSSDISEDSE